MKRVLLFLLLVAVGAWLKLGNSPALPAEELSATLRSEQQPEQWSVEFSAGGSGHVQESASDSLSVAFANRQSNLQLTGSGRVVKVLRDDNQGSPHQRFLLRTSAGQTILIVHNIELAPRISDLAEGDTVAFFGEYEWNDKGGVIHWTHHDPGGRHAGGWLEHRGQRYE